MSHLKNFIVIFHQGGSVGGEAFLRLFAYAYSFKKIWFELFWLDLTWIVLTWTDLICFDLYCIVFVCSSMLMHAHACISIYLSAWVCSCMPGHQRIQFLMWLRLFFLIFLFTLSSYSISPSRSCHTVVTMWRMRVQCKGFESCRALPFVFAVVYVSVFVY